MRMRSHICNLARRRRRRQRRRSLKAQRCSSRMCACGRAGQASHNDTATRRSEGPGGRRGSGGNTFARPEELRNYIWHFDKCLAVAKVKPASQPESPLRHSRRRLHGAAVVIGPLPASDQSSGASLRQTLGVSVFRGGQSKRVIRRQVLVQGFCLGGCSLLGVRRVN